MKSGLKILSVAICLTLLTGCVSREQANDKLGKACEVAASIFLEDGFTIKTVKRVTSKPSKEYGDSYRDVTVFVTESDSWIDIEKEYECVFAEEFGMFNTSFDADLYRIEVDGQVFGMKDGQIIGDPNTHMKLMNAVQSAMQE
tara:strand:+ start:299 stop:727 length:429 start_codon:yes stop_codon:yes gene_type:complete